MSTAPDPTEDEILTRLGRLAKGQKGDQWAPFEVAPNLEQQHAAALQYLAIKQAREDREAAERKAREDREAAERAGQRQAIELSQAQQRIELDAERVRIEAERVRVAQAEVVVRAIEAVGRLPEGALRDQAMDKLLTQGAVSLFGPDRQLAVDSERRD